MSIYNYRLAFSTITKSALNAGNYNLEDFVVPADVPSPAYAWTEPQRPGTTRPVPARVTMNADLSQSFDGFYTWEWYFRYWLTSELAQILTDAFGGVNFYNVGFVPVTVQTWMVDDYVAFHANLLTPVWGQQYQTEDGGYGDVRLRFTKGVIIS